MARNTSTLTVKIVSDASAAAKGFDDASSRVDSFRRGMDRASAAAAVGVAAIAGLAAGAVQAASALEQSTGAVESVFGDQAAAVQKFAAGAADANNLSRRSYQEMAAVVGAQLKNMGVAHEQLAPKTDELIDLGSDLAATFGGPASDAIAAISSLLRGERDPIERYGVSIKQADIEARLAAQGLDELEGEARKAAETQAVMAMLLEQTAGAAGATARESDTAAGATENLKAKWENAQATLGEALLPYLVTLAGYLATAAEWLQQNSDIVGPLAVGFGVFAAAIWLVNAALYANPIVWILGLLALLAAAIVYAYMHADEFRAKLNVLKVTLETAFRGPIAVVQELGRWIAWLVSKISLAKTALGGLGPAASTWNPFGAAGGLTVSHEAGAGLFGATEGSQWAPIRGAAMSPLGGGTSPSASQGSAGAMIVNVNIEGALDPVAVGRQLETVLRDYGRATGRQVAVTNR